MMAIEIKGLCYTFPDGSPGVRDLNLSVKRGEFIVIAGENGSGKTTLCRHLNGLLKPAAGEVWLNGMSVKKNTVRARQLVGLLFQNADTQIVGESVYRDVAFGPENLKLKRVEIDRRTRQALQTVGLTDRENHRPHALSGGEKKRLAIAGVLAMRPEILVFDEPFSNLDYPSSIQIREQIQTLHRENRTILVVTHELEKVIDLATRLIIMKEGTIVEDGNPAGVVPLVEQYGVRAPCSCRFGLGVRSWLS